MKKIFMAAFFIIPFVAFGARDPRVGSSSMVNSPLAPRMAIMSANHVMVKDNTPSVDGSVGINANLVAPANKTATDEINRAREICLGNNVGLGNTFVWASKYSDPSNYSTMQEDVNNPENNVCFARVELKSNDPKIDMSGIPARYFQWGETVECGSWVDEDLLKKRILDAKKTGRVWATVGASVGGAGLGVGAMEGFGNRLIGGVVEGQKNKNLTADELVLSAIKTAENKGDTQRADKLKKAVEKLAEACETQSNHTNCTAYKDSIAYVKK